MLSMQLVSHIGATIYSYDDMTANRLARLGVTKWGYGHHKHDIPLPIRSSPEPLKVSKQACP